MRERAFQGSKLRIARLLNGWTKADLAGQLQLSAQFVHALEIDQLPASHDTVAALSLLLKVQPAFFYEPLQSEVRQEECHFRQSPSLSERTVEKIVSRGTTLEMIIRFLDHNLDLPQVNFPSVEINDDDDIEAAAELCRERWRLGDEPIPNMCRVLETAGAVVTLIDGDAREVDALSMARIRPLVFRDAVSESPGRQRFDLAHECGHLVMHQGLATGDKITEAQADRFAAALLMPRRAFANEFPTISTRLDWPTIYALKIRWGVKARAIIERGHMLGLLDDVRYAGAKRFLSQSGQSQVERYDDKIRYEEPQLLKTAIAAYLEVFACSFGTFAKEVDLTPTMIDELLAQTTLRGSCVRLLRTTAS
jgi:Zn-dependent peptidase ImmA (M78 family)